MLLFSTQVIVQMVGSQILGSILSRECDGDIYPTNNESTHETNDPLWSSKFECGKLPKLDTDTHALWVWTLAAWHPQTPAPNPTSTTFPLCACGPSSNKDGALLPLPWRSRYPWIHRNLRHFPTRCLGPQDWGTLQKEIQIHVFFGVNNCVPYQLYAIPIQAKGVHRFKRVHWFWLRQKSWCTKERLVQHGAVRWRWAAINQAYIARKALKTLWQNWKGFEDNLAT